ncbi:MAG: hypothetical protein ACKOWE_00145 [Micrococcales bacterium]
MTAFDQFLAYLEKQGFRYDTGFLIADHPTDSKIIGYRMVSSVHQVDLYIRDEFWDASKSNPKLGESQEIAPGVLVSAISK